MNPEQSERFIRFLDSNGELKNREELRELLKDETTDEVKQYLALGQEEEY